MLLESKMDEKLGKVLRVRVRVNYYFFVFEKPSYTIWYMVVQKALFPRNQQQWITLQFSYGNAALFF